MYPIYPTSLVPLMTFSLPIVGTTLLKIPYSRVAASYHPLGEAGLYWAGLLGPEVGLR